jgi:hypothetical protein
VLKELAHICWKVEVRQVARCTETRWGVALGWAETEDPRPEVVEEHTGLQLLMRDEEVLDPWAVARSMATARGAERVPSAAEEELSLFAEHIGQAMEGPEAERSCSTGFDGRGRGR